MISARHSLATVAAVAVSVAFAATQAPPAAEAAVPTLTLACGPGSLPPGPLDEWASAAPASAASPPDYYAIDLVPTGRVPGTRLSSGVAYSTFAASPFGISLAASGEYVHDLEVVVTGLKAPREGAYVAWVTDTEISEVVRIGALDDGFRVQGQARWNKFLVVITREPTADPTDMWQGPVILRGMSRSGRMHTMAGHGPFETEPCAKYGFR